MKARPPGPRGVPLLGNAREYARDPFRFLSACGEAYGDLVHFELGPLDTYMVTNPADIERVLVAEDSKFHKLRFGRAVDDLLGDGLLLSEGERWRRQRDLAGPAFAPDRIQPLADAIVDIAADHVADWDEGREVELNLELARLTVRVVVAAMFGIDPDARTVRRVQENLEPLGRRFEPDPRRVLVPEWAPTRENREFDRAVATLEGIIDDLVERRRGTEHEGPTAVSGAGEKPMDLLSILLRARERGEQGDDQLRDELMTMLLAGHDTTALALTYAFVLLSEHPDARERYLAEVDGVVGGVGDGRPAGGDARDGKPTAADVRDLEFTDRALTEAMRLYPPVYAIFRQPQVDVRLAGYRVPAGAAVMLPQWVVHRSGRWYDDPEAFDPGRWESARRRERPRFAYFPFGGGPRHCIGKQFSLLEAKLILATFGQRFALEDVGPDLALRGSLTMHPTEPVRMRVRER